MEVRYQRDLYRVQLCCDTEKEEKELGYPLQMCLRNEIDGLLPCQIQGIDGRVSVCWDVTSRHSIVQMVGEGQMNTAMLQVLLTALQRTMEEMERYLLPCECLVLDPAVIFLRPDAGTVSFVCDFEDPQSFHDSLQVLGEYVLAHMDHRDAEAMHLGYGLYRLAVEETFDRKALSQLCEDDKKGGVQKAEPPENYPSEAMSEPEEDLSDRQLQKEQLLEAFFADDEVDMKKTLPVKGYVLCAAAILSGILLMEFALYFRNGQHLPVWWPGAGAGLFVLTAVVLTALQVVSGKKEAVCREEKQEVFTPRYPKRERERPQDIRRKTDEKSGREYAACSDRRTYAAYRPDTVIYPAHTAFSSRAWGKEETQETMVLNCVKQTEAGRAMMLFADGRKEYLQGSHWVIGKSSRDADICLSQPTVSRWHACITKKEEGYYIEDLHSKNGTYLGKNSLEAGQIYRLESGQKIRFADQCCEFRME